MNCPVKIGNRYVHIEDCVCDWEFELGKDAELQEAEVSSDESI